MKKLAKKIVVTILTHQVRQLRRRHDFKVVAVVGSIGKTSTKLAVAETLSQKYRVQYQDGNYNDLVTVPLIFFGQSMPSLMNPLAWLATFWRNGRQIHRPYPYDVVVLELGTDGPGQIDAFRRYGQVDISVVTALTPEHMEFFADLDAVAAEELSVTTFSTKLVVNVDLCADKYLQDVSVTSYAIRRDATYRITEATLAGGQYSFRVQKQGQPLLAATHESVAEAQLYSLLAAVTVGDQLGMTSDEMVAGFNKVVPVSGRMQLLKGINDSLILDDTYNASPEAVKSALNTLYEHEAPQKIALLGNMNELGHYSEEAHKEVGQYCDPAKLDLLVTLAGDANTFLADEAEAKGCRVIRTTSPYEAAQKIRENMKPGALILAKGSQNRVFAEEAVKSLLADPKDAAKLVRQSADWMHVKNAQFNR